tara:strand:- start:46 stop:783 length:738 start_codon:yes stop_codon:yes gene_type:complete
MKLLMENWRKYLKEAQPDPRATSLAQLKEPGMEGYWSGERKTVDIPADYGEEGAESSDCPKRFNVPWGYTMGDVAEEDREYSARGRYQVDPKNEENFERIGRQDIMAVKCDPSLFDGKRYIVWKNQPAPSPGRRDRGRQPTWKERDQPGPEEGSVYRSEQIFYQAFDDLEEAKRSAIDFSKTPGGKEVFQLGGTIEVHDREDDRGGYSISRTQAPEEAPITPATGMDPSNYSQMGPAGPKEYYEE